jgi:hypothetical protein
MFLIVYFFSSQLITIISVAGIDRYPRKITKSMGEKKIAKRSLMKPFVKRVNFTHMMPTRYQVIWSYHFIVIQMKLGNALVPK